MVLLEAATEVVIDCRRLPVLYPLGVKSISEMERYKSFSSADGIIQFASSSSTVPVSIALTLASTVKSKAAM